MAGPIRLRYEGNGDFRVLSNQWAERADKEYVVDEVYPFVEWHDRSQASHDQQFAYIGELWASIPERFSNEPWAQSPDHLRKFALIKCRYCDTQTYTCGSRAEAERWARNLRPLDEYSIVSVEGTTVYRFTAQSQSKRAMGAKLFQESKSAIIEFIEDLVGIRNEAAA